MKRGIWFALAAFVGWGLFPIYWKWLGAVPAMQLLAHRVVWSFAILMGFIIIAPQWPAFRRAAFKPRTLGLYLMAAIFISINWGTFLWAVNAGFVLQSSLGYFINPLLSIVLGVVFLRERLRLWQWAAIGLAAVGVLYLTVSYGAVPWISLTLATSFGLYGLIKKKAPLGSVHGLALETGWLFLPALLWLLISDLAGHGAFLHTGRLVDVALICGGLITIIPLVLFAAALQRVPLSLVGFLQYINPTLQFLLGVLVYHEPFSQAQLIGFSIVWLALVFFGIEGLVASRRDPAAAAALAAGGVEILE
jgi:chloramphenicol-sensitive protein RarD